MICISKNKQASQMHHSVQGDKRTAYGVQKTMSFKNKQENKEKRIQCKMINTDLLIVCLSKYINHS